MAHCILCGIFLTESIINMIMLIAYVVQDYN